jgi:hypothetical protein
MFLDAALCWHPSPSSSSHERRLVPSTLSPHHRLPSWSWVGLSGRLSGFGCWNGACDYAKALSSMQGSSTTWRTVPILQWYSRQSATSEPKPISVQWDVYNLKESSLKGIDDPPKGWTRSDYIVDESFGDYGLPPEVIPPRYFYTHESQPTSDFWYVLPLNHTQPPVPQNRDTFLSCRTQRTWLVRAER